MTDARDDRELVAAANQGEEAAFTELFRRHRDWVVSLAWRFLGSRDDALDVMQETFAYLFERFPDFELSSTMRAFLYPVVKHQSISLARKRRRVVSIDAAERAHADGELEATWQLDEASDFDKLVAGLPEGHREVLRLRFALGLQLEEIAEILELPLGTVKSRLHNALKALREAAGG